MVGICPNCDGGVDSARDSAVSCDGCKAAMHLQCTASSTGLSKDEISRITRKRIRSLKIMCKKCDANLSQMLDVRAVIKAETMKLLERIAALEAQVQEVSARKNDDGNVLPPLQFEEIVCEINERNSRKKNVVIFNLAEPPSNFNKDQRYSKEKSILAELFNSLSTDIPTNVQSFRLGVSDTNRERPRPLKVTLPNEADVLKIIKNAKKLKGLDKFKNISISFDRTPRQISYYQELKSELIERQNNGEMGLKIKYIHGVPKITSLN